MAHALSQKFQTVMASTLAAVGSVAFIAGCGSNEPGGRIVDGVAKEAVKVEMRAIWTAGCQDAGTLADLFDFKKMREEIDYGDSFKKTTTFFTDEACNTPAVVVTENGDFAVENQVQGKVYQLNQRFNSVSINPVSEDGKTKLNTVLACNKSDWTVNQAVDVTNDTSAINRCWTKTPREIFDIVEIRDSKLRYGLVEGTKDKSAADKRPEKLNEDATATYSRTP